MSNFLAEVDVVIVGSGNAGFSAALSAKEYGAGKVLIVEKAPEDWLGGNSYFTAGAFRVSFGSLDDLLVLPLSNLSPGSPLIPSITVPPYPPSSFLHDLNRITSNRCHPKLANLLAYESLDAVKWLSAKGISFGLSFNRQGYKIQEDDGKGGKNERWQFWGGMVLATEGGGKGLVEKEKEAALRNGVEIWCECPMIGLIGKEDSGGIGGIKIIKDGKEGIIKAKGGVIMACGGFEANPEMRAKYLGPSWDLCHVRGTPHNTGDGHQILFSLPPCPSASIFPTFLPAQTAGHYSGCHAVAWDAFTNPHEGDRKETNGYTKSGYPLGITVDGESGKRFVDEGSDFRNYTYATMGRKILQQSSASAFQIYDSKTIPWMRTEEYSTEILKPEHRIEAETLGELVDRMILKGLPAGAKEVLLQEVEEFNEAVRMHRNQFPNRKWNPSTKDGLSTNSNQQRLAIPKSNWALPIDEGPFLAVKITTGITFTFGGVKVDPATASIVSGPTSQAIPGLYAAGEIVGGAFYSNYPGGSGLTIGTILGRKAGQEAGIRANS